MSARITLPCGHVGIEASDFFARFWGLQDVPCNWKGQGVCGECGKVFTVEIKATEVKPKVGK